MILTVKKIVDYSHVNSTKITTRKYNSETKLFEGDWSLDEIDTELNTQPRSFSVTSEVYGGTSTSLECAKMVEDFLKWAVNNDIDPAGVTSKEEYLSTVFPTLDISTVIMGITSVTEIEEA